MIRGSHLLPILIAVLVLCVFWPASRATFQFDDSLFLSDDNIRLGRWLGLLWPPAPRPLTWLTFLVQYRLHGPEPFFFHLFNLILHSLNAVLLFFLLHRLLPPARPGFPVAMWAALGSLLFALHPIQTGTVAYVYQRSTLLAALFSLLTLLSHLSGRHRAALLWLVLALASKEFTAVLPLFLLSLQALGIRAPEGRQPCGGRAGRNWLLVYLAVAVGLGLAPLLVARSWPSASAFLVQSTIYAATQVHVLWSYLGLLALPLSLNLDPDVAPVIQLGPGWWLRLAGLVLMVGALLRWRRFSPPASWLALFFLAFLLPTSSLLPRLDFMFEHRLYLPLAGLAGLLVLALADLGGRAAAAAPRPARPLVRLLPAIPIGLLLVAYSGWDRDRLAVWRDEESLWRDTVSGSPGKYRPNLNLGVVLMERSPREAMLYLSQAIAIEPTLPFAHRSLGEAHHRLGNTLQGERSWLRALALDPGHPETHLALGELYAERADFFRARQHLSRAQQLSPRDWRSYLHLARLHLRFGFPDQAILHSQLGLNRHSEHTGMRLLLAQAVARSGDSLRAEEIYQEVLDREPGSSQAYLGLARLRLVRGNRAGALELARKGQAAASPGPEREEMESFLEDLLSLEDP